MARAFQLHPADNVATLLEDTSGEPVAITGSSEPLEITPSRAIALAHKIALCDIPEGGPVVKYGVPIGLATCLIRRGDWVHLHNCRSAMDERSSTLDVESGAATDTVYE